MKLNILTIIACLFFAVSSSSQNFKKEKRIYLLDITKSMFGLAGTPNIFDEVRNALYEGIENIDNPETLITIIPFQGTDTNTQKWTFTLNDGAFKDIKKIINSYTIVTVPGHNTDIYSALKKGQDVIDPNRLNYIYLLTDGGQSPKGPSVKFDNKDLINLLNEWCVWAKGKDSNLFYVLLTDAAKNENVYGIVEEQCNAFNVSGLNVNIVFLRPTSSELIINLLDKPRELEIELSANDWGYINSGIEITVKLNSNSLFELEHEVVSIVNKKVILKLRTMNGASFQDLQKNNPQETILDINISTDSNVKILEPNIKVIVKNRKERVLKLEFVNNEG
jgi:hypothetical protein